MGPAREQGPRYSLRRGRNRNQAADTESFAPAGCVPPFPLRGKRFARDDDHFAGVPPSSRTTNSYPADWRSSRPATSRNRSTSSAGSTKLVDRFMK